MIPRYEDPKIGEIWSDEKKLLRWDDVQRAVLEARLNVSDEMNDEEYEEACRCIGDALANNPPDIAWWRKRDSEIHHDLVAYVEERRRHIPPKMHWAFHKDMTSFDVEEPAFARALIDSWAVVNKRLEAYGNALEHLADAHRHTIMLERTHGQWAKLASFGGRILTYIAELRFAQKKGRQAVEDCSQSRIAGAVGNYGGGLSPELEREALGMLGLEPLYGATQILPRVVYAALAQALLLIVEALGKTALDIRLGARSGTPLWHEPFGKKQKGSSAMPHKKNTIATEQMEGMVRLARGSCAAIVSNIPTWERRAIEQSCVERVAWPDLFHVVARMLTVMEKVMRGLVVYPDAMLREVVASQGTYASDEAKNFLAEQLGKRGIGADVAYRIVQLASFNVCALSPAWREIEGAYPCANLAQADHLFSRALAVREEAPRSICDHIAEARLCLSPDLEASEAEVTEWNGLLRDVFASASVREAWASLFTSEHLLQHEERLFAELSV